MFLMGAARIFPQGTPPRAPAPAKFEATELQQAKLEAKQARAQLAQQRYTDAGAVFNQAAAEFNAEVEAVKKANGWPESVHLDANVFAKTGELKFIDTPAPPPPVLDKPTGPPVQPAKGKN